MILNSLTSISNWKYIDIGAWRSWLAHLVRDQGVVRSNRIAPIFLIVFLFVFSVFAAENNSGSFNGPTGLMNIPSGNVLDGNEQTISLHRFQIKYNYGIMSLLEIGARTNLERVSTFEELAKNFTFNAKGQLLNEQDWFVNLAVGAENSNYYIAIDKHIRELEDLYIVAGTGNARFHYLFIGFSKYVNPVLQIMAEYDGDDYNVGTRLTLSPKIKFDLYIYKINNLFEYPYLNDIINTNIIFGISYSEYLNLDLFKGVF